MFTHSNLLISGGTFNHIESPPHHYDDHGHTGFDILLRHIAPGAFHNSSERFDPPKCHPRTRVATLDAIMKWIEGLDDALFPLMWLYGAAGAGKSAIAQTIAEECYKRKLLIASFFFCRTVANRNNPRRLFATIAYQLALAIPKTRIYIERAIQDDPLIFDRNIEVQMEELIVQPLLHTTSLYATPRKLIIIDGLDECNHSSVQRHLLTVLSSILSRYQLPLIFLIASRAEHTILATFNSDELKHQTTRLALDHSPYRSDTDIREFLESKFTNIRKIHPLSPWIPNSWPSASDINKLVSKASGQFIYVSTVIKYVESPQHKPTERLEAILGVSKLDWAANGAVPFAELDNLYGHLLGSITDYSLTKRILGAIIMGDVKMSSRSFKVRIEVEQSVQNDFTSPELVASILFSNLQDLYLALNELSSVIELPSGGTKGSIRVLHASLGDFLSDPSRSGAFHIQRERVHTDLARSCLKLISASSSSDFGFFKSSEHNVTKYAWTHMMSHCIQSLPTSELIADLRNFDLERWLAFVPADNINISVYEILDCFLAWLKLPEVISIDPHIYHRHLQPVDEHVRRLAKYPPSPDSDFLHLLTCWSVSDTIPTFYTLWGILVQWEPHFTMNTKRDTIEFQFRSLCSLGQVLRNFLVDQERAGELWISKETYARTTLICIKSLYDPRRDTPHFNIDDSMEVWFIMKTIPRLLRKASYLYELVEYLDSVPCLQVAPWIYQRFCENQDYRDMLSAIATYQELEGHAITLEDYIEGI